MSLWDRQPVVGDGVVLRGEATVMRVNSYTSDRLTAGTQFIITRVYTTRVQVRTVELFDSDYHPPRGRSYTFGKHDLDYDEEAVQAASAAGVTVPRRLGKKPEDTEDMQFIGPDHPGIQWLFEDMGKFATDQGYCQQYDALCARLGIPGRPRPFNVARTVNGITLTTTVDARSQAEANEKVDIALGINKPTEGPPSDNPDPEPAPSDPRFPIAA